MSHRNLKLTPEILSWVHAAGPLHLLVGQLPAWDYVSLAITNAGRHELRWRVEQEWSPDARILKVGLVVPTFKERERLHSGRVGEGRLLMPGETSTL